MAAPSISRAQGYALAAGKEDRALAAAEEFLAQALDLASADLNRIDGADDNWRLGDLRLPNGTTIEVKGQPINPGKYRRNFVEIAEITNTPRHADGFTRLASLLHLTEDQLAAIPVTDHTKPGKPVAPLGRPPRMSVSITSMGTAALAVYANAVDGYLYAYRREELMPILRTAVLRGLNRGQGRSNDDTLGVLVALPRWRFQRAPDGLWAPMDAADPEAVYDAICAHLHRSVQTFPAV